MFIQTVARMLADTFGIDVVYSNLAETFSIERKNDKFILQIPSKMMAVYPDCQDEATVLTRGALAHEIVGHAMHTNFDVFGEVIPMGKLAVGVFNLIEDIRIERAAPTKYPTTATFLNDMAVMLSGPAFGFWQPFDESDPMNNLFVGLLRKNRREVLRQDLDPAVTDEMLARAALHLDARLIAEITRLFDAGCVSGSSEEVAEATSAILALLQQAKPKQDPQDQGEDAETGGEGDSGDSSGSGSSPSSDDAGDGESGDQDDTDDSAGGSKTEDSDEDDGSDAGDSKPGEPDEDAGENPDNPDSRNGKGTDSDGEDGEDESDPSSGTAPQDSTDGKPDGAGDEAKQSLSGDDDAKADKEAKEPGDSQPVSNWTFDSSQQIHGTVEDAFADALLTTAAGTGWDLRKPSQRILTNASFEPDADNAMRLVSARLEDAIASEVDDEDDSYSVEGKLDMQRLPAIVAGFEKEPFILPGDIAEGVDTELMLVMDESDSMSKMDQSGTFLRTLLWSLLHPMVQFQPDLSFSCWTFTTAAACLIPQGTHVSHAVVKQACARYVPDGGTSWHPSVAPLVPVLAQSRRQRKILLTVTDGSFATEPCQQVIEDAESLGIELFFLCLKGAVPPGAKGISVPTLAHDAVAKAFCDILMEGILAKRHH